MPGAPVERESREFHVRDRGALPIFLALAGVCGAPILIAYAVLTCGTGPVQSVAEARESALCRSRLRIIAAGLNAYSVDFDGRYPPGNVWVDASWPYAVQKSPSDQFESAFRCPTVSKLRTAMFGYAIAEGAGGATRAEYDRGEVKVLVFDAADSERNAVKALDALPDPPRHANATANYAAMTDGSVKPIERP